METYHGGYHCGAVKFEVDADLSPLTRCTCSICAKKGCLFCYVPPDQFRHLQGEDDLKLYQFHTNEAKHLFYKQCGIHAFSRPRSMLELHLINVRCLDDFYLETETYEVERFDGRNWDAAIKARQESG